MVKDLLDVLSGIAPSAPHRHGRDRSRQPPRKRTYYALATDDDNLAGAISALVTLGDPLVLNQSEMEILVRSGRI
jgi:hypothetical protein